MFNWEDFKKEITDEVIRECEEIKVKYEEENGTGEVDEHNLYSVVDLCNDLYIFIDVSTGNEKLSCFLFSVEGYDNERGIVIGDAVQITKDTSIESIKYSIDILLESCKQRLTFRKYAAEVTIKAFYNTAKLDEVEIQGDIASEIKQMLNKSVFEDYKSINVRKVMPTERG